MTLYNPIRDVTGATPAPTGTDFTQYVFALYFTVTAGCNLNGVWWYCNASGGQYTNTAGTEYVALNDVTSDLYIVGSKTAGGIYSQGWNLISFSSPIALTSGHVYAALKGSDGTQNGKGYPATSGFFSNGGGLGENGISDGPGLIYSSGRAPSGVSNMQPQGYAQQAFTANSLDVTQPPAAGGYNSTWYGMDIQLATGSSPSGPTLSGVALSGSISQTNAALGSLAQSNALEGTIDQTNGLGGSWL